MGADDPIDVDPAALADPLGGGSSEPAEAGENSPAPTLAVPSSGARALVPADPFRKYLAEIRRYPPLTREEERDLARHYRETGDRDALFRLITSNLMLVVRVALSFRRTAKNLLDLVQEGNLGLLQAIDRFDPDLGVRLPTYAAWWIRAHIIKYLLDNVRLVRVGTTNARRKLLYNLRREKARLESAGFEAGPRQLADHFGVSEADVTDVQKALDARDVSLDAPIGGDENRTHADVVPDDAPTVEEEVARREIQERMEAALRIFRERLNQRERAILDERILSDDPLTLQALGDRFGTTREAVRQSEARLMSRLKEFLAAEFGDLASVKIGPD